MISLEASNAQIASLVAAWQRPVDVQDMSPKLTGSVTEPQLVALPGPETAPPADREQVLQPEMPKVLALQHLDTTPPQMQAVPSRPNPTPDIRPVARSTPEIDVEPAPKPATVTSTAHAKETARGQAGGAAGTTQQKRETPGASAAARQSLLAEWGGQIRSRIERQKRYPRGVRSTGTAQLSLTVSGTGALISVSLRHSSGDPLLDQAALVAVRNAHLPAKPRDLSGDSHRFNLPVAFTR